MRKETFKRGKRSTGWLWCKLILGLTISGCSNPPTTVSDIPEILTPECHLPPLLEDPQSPVALFEIHTSLPYPFDVFTKQDPESPTGIVLDLGDKNTILIDRGIAFAQDILNLIPLMNQIDGFSVFGPIVFGFSMQLDETLASLEPETFTNPDAPVFVWEIDGNVPKAIPIRVQIRNMEQGDVIKGLLVIEPFYPLKPATKYVAVVLRSVKGANGKMVIPHPDFRAVMGYDGQLPSDPRSQRIAELLKVLEGHICLEDIASATVFTTRKPQAKLENILAFMKSPNAPPMNFSIEKDENLKPKVYAPKDLPFIPEGQDLSESSLAIKGSFDSPDFRSENKDVYLWKPISYKNMKVPFVVLMPKDKKYQPFKVVMMVHGHSGQKERVAYLAKRFGEKGIALMAIDLIGHGELKDTGVFMTMDMHEVRGSFIQSQINILRAFQAVENLKDIDVFPPDNPDGILDLDIEEFGLVGESLGSLTGAIACALYEQCRALVLNVGGGGISNFAPDTVGQALLGADQVTYFGLKSLLQDLLDEIDPIAYADKLRRDGKMILMQAVVGDPAFDGPPTIDLARSLGLSYICPCPIPLPYLKKLESPVVGNGLFYFNNVVHGFFLANQSNFACSDKARIQAAHFLASGLRNGKGEIVDSSCPSPR